MISKGISQSPEGRKIFRRMTVRENLEMGAYHRNDTANIREDMDRVFELFPRLQERVKQEAGTMSGGEQQMLAIGRAIMSRPKLLLLDEPSMGLAPVLVERIFQTIQEINQQGTTILLVEQNANVALEIATRGYVLETGSIVNSAPAEKLREDPKVREAYLAKSRAAFRKEPSRRGKASGHRFQASGRLSVVFFIGWLDIAFSKAYS